MLSELAVYHVWNQDTVAVAEESVFRVSRGSTTALSTFVVGRSGAGPELELSTRKLANFKLVKSVNWLLPCAMGLLVGLSWKSYISWSVLMSLVVEMYQRSFW
jgi:hypothetical protein